MLHSVKVRDYMTERLVTFRPDDDIFSAIQTLVNKQISGAPVVDEEGRLVGMLSEADCLQTAMNATYFNTNGGKVSEFMSTNVDTIDVESNVVAAAEMFIKDNRRRLPVVENGKLAGQVSRIDILRAMVSFMD